MVQTRLSASTQSPLPFCEAQFRPSVSVHLLPASSWKNQTRLSALIHRRLPSASILPPRLSAFQSPLALLSASTPPPLPASSIPLPLPASSNLLPLPASACPRLLSACWCQCHLLFASTPPPVAYSASPRPRPPAGVACSRPLPVGVACCRLPPAVCRPCWFRLRRLLFCCSASAYLGPPRRVFETCSFKVND